MKDKLLEVMGEDWLPVTVVSKLAGIGYNDCVAALAALRKEGRAEVATLAGRKLWRLRDLTANATAEFPVLDRMVHDVFKSVREWMGDAVWKPGDGPAPLVFADKPEGAQCAWSCRWLIGGLRVAPTDLVGPPSELPSAMLWHEVLDHSSHGDLPFNDTARNFIARYRSPDDELPRELLVDTVSSLRAFPAEFICPWGGIETWTEYFVRGGKLIELRQRPGWPVRPELHDFLQARLGFYPKVQL